jgi:broad specificity phosphatase PhoE
MRILLLRHAATAWTATGQHTGHTDLPLTEAGETEARATAPLFAAMLGNGGLSAIYSSPRQRVLRTVELVVGRTAGIVIDEALAEVDYGDFEGLTPAEIQARAPGWWLWNDGCPGGETLGAVEARVDGFIARLGAAKHDGTVCIASHGHLSRAFCARLLGMPLGAAGAFAINTCAIADFSQKDGRFLLSAWNRTR